jgi:hypothetical protein
MASLATEPGDGHAPDIVFQGFFSLIQDILRTSRRASGILNGRRGINMPDWIVVVRCGAFLRPRKKNDFGRRGTGR